MWICFQRSPTHILSDHELSSKQAPLVTIQENWESSIASKSNCTEDEEDDDSEGDSDVDSEADSSEESDDEDDSSESDEYSEGSSSSSCSSDESCSSASSYCSDQVIGMNTRL